MTDVNVKKPVFEVFEVHQTEIACDGGSGPTGHPRVFLHIDRAVGEITCPYCSRQFVLSASSHH